MGQRRDYDLVILGGGSAGIVAGVMAGGLGLRVLLVEKSRMGGECLNTGCVPSKALIASAQMAWEAQRADRLGLPARVLTREECAPVMRRVREAIGQVREADATVQLLKDHGVRIEIGDARFLDPHAISLGDLKISAENFLLATGSRPLVPDLPGLAEAGYLTNDTVWDLDEIPPRLLVMGGGPVGLELGQAFAKLGSRVTVIHNGPRVLERADSELSEHLLSCLRGEGIDVRLNVRVTSVRCEGDDRIAVVQTDEGEEEIACDRIVAAVGRQPNVEGLDLQSAGVACEPDGIPVNSALRTSRQNIYACGDVLGKHQFSHMAEYEAKIAVRNIVFPGKSPASFRVAPWAIFTDPEIVRIGITEDEARERKVRFDISRQSFAQNDRAITEGRAAGFIKVLTQGLRGEILGVHVVGPSASELAQEWVLAMEQGLSIRAIADMVHVYPTLSMASQHAAQRWYGQKASEPAVRRALNSYVKVLRPHGKTLARGAALIGAGALAAAFVRRERP